MMDGPVVMDHPDLTAKGGALSLTGPSVAMAFVTEGIDLLWSASPDARATEVKFAATSILRITSVRVSPLLNDSVAHQAVAKNCRVVRK